VANKVDAIPIEVYKEAFNQCKIGYSVISIFGNDFLNFKVQPFFELFTDFFNHLKFVRTCNSIKIAFVNRLSTRIENLNTSQKRFIENISYFFKKHMKIVNNNNIFLIYSTNFHAGYYYCKMEPKLNYPSVTLSLISMV
jgi:hypothetical protein